MDTHVSVSTNGRRIARFTPLFAVALAACNAPGPTAQPAAAATSQASAQAAPSASSEPTILHGSQSYPALDAAPRSVHLLELDQEILALHQQHATATGAEEASLREESGLKLKARAEELRQLIDEDPEAALVSAFSADQLQSLRLAFPEAAGELESHWSWSGAARVVIGEDASLTHERIYLTVQDGGRTLNIRLADTSVELQSGSTVRATGILAPGQSSGVAHAELTDTPIGTGGTCATTGPQSAAVIYLSFPGVGNAMSVSQVQSLFFGSTGRTVNGFLADDSYGQVSLSGDVLGPYALGQGYDCTDYTSIQTAALAAAAADVDLSQYNRFYIVFPIAAGATCYYAGLGDVGCSPLTLPDGTQVNASVSWLINQDLFPNPAVVNDVGAFVASHETGHNLGLNHGNSLTYPTETLAAPGLAAPGATNGVGLNTEYGDLFNTMGEGYTWSQEPLHYAARQKMLLGWLDPAANVAQVNGNGSTLLYPLEDQSLSEIKAVRVQRGLGTNEWLWFQYREAEGNYDNVLSTISSLSGEVQMYWEGTTPTTYVYALNANPQSFASESMELSAFPVGQGFSDDYTGVSVTFRAPTSGPGVYLDVSYLPAQCVNAPPPTATLAAPASAANGTAAKLTYSLKSNAPAGCPATSYPLSDLLPNYWTGSLTATALSIAGGATASTTLTVNVPTYATSGGYTVGVNTKKAGTTTGIQTTLTVKSSCAFVAPTVSVSPMSTTGGANDFIPFTATITNHSSAGCGTIAYHIAPTTAANPYWADIFYPEGTTDYTHPSGIISLAAGKSGTIQLDKWLVKHSPGDVVNWGLVTSADGVPDPTLATTVTPQITVTTACTRTLTATPPTPDVAGSTAWVDLAFAESASCRPASILMGFVAPAGDWYEGGTVTINALAGKTVHASVELISPVDAEGPYPSNGYATWWITPDYGPSFNSDATVNITPALGVSVTTSVSSLKVGAAVRITATSTVGNAPAAGATVTFTVKPPSGSSTTYTETAAADGTAYVDYVPSVKGNYKASASSSLSGQTASSGSTPITVTK